MKECQLLESALLDSIDITSDSVYNNRNSLMFNFNEEELTRQLQNEFNSEVRSYIFTVYYSTTNKIKDSLFIDQNCGNCPNAK